MNNPETELIYHYCKFSTFEQIIKNKTIRLQDITKSNDSSEILWALRQIREFYKECDGYKPGDTQLDLYVQKCLDSLFYQNDTNDDNFIKFFVACFSFQKDMLSQWRGYADDGQGVAIGFDKGLLMKNECCGYKLLGLRSGSVIYDESEQYNFIKNNLEWFYECEGKMSDIDKKNITFNDETREAFFKLLLDAVFIKNPFFSEEKEWRVAMYGIDYPVSYKGKLQVNEIFPKDFQFGNSFTDKGLIQYCDVSFDPSVIKEVVLGPKNMSSIGDVRNYLIINGIDAQVKKSVGTYR
ncbi:Protein of unknown function [Ruminococcaceae bacterium KH2T8]|nr:Protein of unknown function [Ruminococcaceae bacterium KH2T8]